MDQKFIRFQRQFSASPGDSHDKGCHIPYAYYRDGNYVQASGWLDSKGIQNEEKGRHAAPMEDFRSQPLRLLLLTMIPGECETNCGILSNLDGLLA